MDKETMATARAQFLKYFRFWFIAVGVLAALALAVFVMEALEEKTVRTNTQAPAERVYDEADVLTDSEEDALREMIAEVEELIHGDVVLVTSNRIMEGQGAASPESSWETNMMHAADDFYDHNGFGYDKPQGNGVLILDNWYEGQAGSWLSTCGTMIEKFGSYEVDRVLDEIYYGVEDGAYEAYRAGIEMIGYIAGDEEYVDLDGPSFYLIGFVISTVAALIFIAVKLRNKDGEKTVTAGTYVEGRPVENVHRDQFIRKIVTRRKIPRQTGSSSGGGSSRSSGGGSSHRSSSGVSHGGGGRRR